MLFVPRRLPYVASRGLGGKRRRSPRCLGAPAACAGRGAGALGRAAVAGPCLSLPGRRAGCAHLLESMGRVHRGLVAPYTWNVATDAAADLSEFAANLRVDEGRLLHVLNEHEPPEQELARALDFIADGSPRLAVFRHAGPWSLARPLLLQAPRWAGIYRRPELVTVFVIAFWHSGVACFLLAFQAEDAGDAASSSSAGCELSSAAPSRQPPPAASFAAHAAFCGPFIVGDDAA